MTDALRAISWLAMTQLIFNEDQIEDLIYETTGETGDVRAAVAEAERLGYCSPMETIDGPRHQFGAHPSRAWRSRLWIDTPHD